jgi:hypothetical protein
MEEVHLAVLLLTVVAIVWADHLGFQYFRGTRQTLPAHVVRGLHVAVAVGLAGMIGTGAWMALDRWGYLSTQPVFWLKLFFVGVLVVNALFITRLMQKATHTPFASLLPQERIVLFVSGALSTIGWVSAAVIGLFFL